MNFTAYIQSQKSMIRRRCGLSFISEEGEIISVPDREKLLGELDKMAGLNVEGRKKYGLCRAERQ